MYLVTVSVCNEGNNCKLLEWMGRVLLLFDLKNCPDGSGNSASDSEMSMMQSTGHGQSDVCSIADHQGKCRSIKPAQSLSPALHHRMLRAQVPVGHTGIFWLKLPKEAI